ncbi:hypothetical protein ACIG87_15270 [Micromonospora sp. NPDC051925]|uniref:hypothetical protein n=1 Tax=Micromonospora sp. NPDC051925 TaxID=3364288 RepID=UPI0037CA3CFC
MPATRTIIVTFPSGSDANWFTASEVIDHHLNTAGTPVRRFAVRHRRMIGWITRWFDTNLLDAVRRFGSVTRASGGRLSRLNLTATVTNANNEATARWRMWHQYIATTTPTARTWEDFQAQHQADPKKISIDEARRRFEQQPRVLAMIAMSAHPTATNTFDPYELDAYQAGEATYAALHWKTALVGDALITAEGQLLEPTSPSLADRLRYLQRATSYLHGMRSHQRLCAVAID